MGIKNGVGWKGKTAWGVLWVDTQSDKWQGIRNAGRLAINYAIISDVAPELSSKIDSRQNTLVGRRRSTRLGVLAACRGFDSGPRCCYC